MMDCFICVSLGRGAGPLAPSWTPDALSLAASLSAAALLRSSASTRRACRPFARRERESESVRVPEAHDTDTPWERGRLGIKDSSALLELSRDAVDTLADGDLE